MADYYPLIVRAVSTARDAPPETRAEVYARARAALMKHLRAADPPLPPETIAREEMALDETIAQVEAEILGDGIHAAAPVEAPRRPPAPIAMKAAETPAAPRRRWRLLLTGGAVTVFAAGVAVYAVANKDDPARYEARPPVAATPEPVPAGPKIGERVTGDPAAPAPAPAPTATASAPAASAPAVAPDNPAVAVAQRAILYEEKPETPNAPTVVNGRAVWRLDSVAADQGQPADTAVKVEIEFPERQIGVEMTLRRNTEPALQASHLIEVKFAFRAGGGPVKELASPPTMKAEENQRGAPLIGLTVPVMENFFLVGLSSAPADIERNVSQLQSANWIDIPFRYGNDRIGVIAIEKGTQGAEAIQNALVRWRS